MGLALVDRGYEFACPDVLGFKIMLLDCVIDRRRIAIQPPPSIFAKNIILKPKKLAGIGFKI